MSFYVVIILIYLAVRRPFLPEILIGVRRGLSAFVTHLHSHYHYGLAERDLSLSYAEALGPVG